MSILVGVLSQKGGVGKSMVARLLATEYVRIGWNTLIADMDGSQSTSSEWSQRRNQQEIKPSVDVKEFSMVGNVLVLKKDYDIIIFDGAPHSTLITKEIAENSDLIVLPTGSSLDDLNPQIRLAHELVDSGIDSSKVVFLLSRVGNSEVELNDVIDYINQTGYTLLKGYIPEKTAFRLAIREGRSLTETRYSGLTEKCESVAQSVADKINELTN